jgi:hypothetical protein
MKVLTLSRSYLSDRVVGILHHKEGLHLNTLERPWVNNHPNISCIPEGIYHVKRDKEGKHKYYSVRNVEGRTAIELHTGNKVAHSAGCILVGMSFDERYNLNSSTRAMDKLLSAIGDNGFILHIRAANKDDF